MLWWEEQRDVLQLCLETAAACTTPETFGYDNLERAARRAAELLAEGDPQLADAADAFLTVDEHRQLEATLRLVVEASHTVSLAMEDRAQLDVLIEMLQLQLRAPRPDRPILGRILKGLATVGGGLLLSIAGNYLTDLLERFGMPWP